MWNWFVNTGNGSPQSSVNDLDVGDVIFYSWDGGPIWDHVTVVIEDNGNSDFYIASHTTNSCRSYWTFGGALKYGFMHINGGSSQRCTAPALLSPNDGEIKNSQTVTFQWNTLSGCTYNGYTFRVKNTSNMDSGGTTIIDTGEGSTQRTETINGWDNQDLYWGVKAANAPNGADWSVRRFRISPTPPPSKCSAPSLIAPNDGETLTSSTVTFRWNALGGCTFNGYTFRLCTSSNVDNLSNCFIDTGEGGTQRVDDRRPR